MWLSVTLCGTANMAALVLGCRKALVITGWVISVSLHIVTKGLLKHSSHLVGAPFFALWIVFSLKDLTTESSPKSAWAWFQLRIRILVLQTPFFTVGKGLGHENCCMVISTLCMECSLYNLYTKAKSCFGSCFKCQVS